MSDKMDSIIEKFNEYGMIIFRDYPINNSDTKQHVFICEGMVLFLDYKDDSLSVSFYAGLKPEDVSRNTLILNEIEDFDDLYIMESYILDNHNKFICGEEAFKLLKKSDEVEFIKGFAKNQLYEEILKTAKCYYC